jgi:hypothetical protein
MFYKPDNHAKVVHFASQDLTATLITGYSPRYNKREEKYTLKLPLTG